MWTFRNCLPAKPSRWMTLLGSLALVAIVWRASPTSAQTKAAAIPPRVAIPANPGWYEIPNTQIAPLCPSTPAIEGNTGCRAVISAWNGGIADTAGNRLILWGGGHNDYFGNEVYALDLSTLTMSRLNDASAPTNVNDCPEAYPDGRPSARHTYSGLAYLPHQDSMFVYGGSKSVCGGMSGATWTFDLAALNWRKAEPQGIDRPANTPGALADYDPNTGMVFLSDTVNLFRYDPAAARYQKLNSLRGVDYHLSGIIDPVRKWFFMIGGPGQFWAIDIQHGSRFAPQDWAGKVHGCDALLHANSPGLAYDSDSKQIVGWAGGDTVYLFDAHTRSCTAETHPGGPGPAQPNGTFGRFRYFPALGVFVLVNGWKQNAFLLRVAPTNAVAAPTQRGNN
jgi:hypothetical protein